MGKIFLKQILLTLFFLTVGACGNNSIKGDYVRGEYVVKLKRHSDSTEVASNSGVLELSALSKNENVFLLKADDTNEEEVLKRIDELSELEDVLIVEPNYIYHASFGGGRPRPRPEPEPEPEPEPDPEPEPEPEPDPEPDPEPEPDPSARTPNDPRFAELWGLKNSGQRDSEGELGVSGADTQATHAWALSTGSHEVVVAVVDTGVDYNHPDLKANMWSKVVNGRTVHGYNAINGSHDPMDDNGHGTHVAGTIGAVGDNGIGVTGVNWKVKIMALKFLNRFGSGSLSDAIKCLDFARENGAHVVNNSWGGGGFSRSLLEAFVDLENAGISAVAAAGNERNDNDRRASYPASYEVESLISVASSNNRDMLSDFSNYGRNSVDLLAPGENILSTWIGGTYRSISGTSMASPHVAGAIALLLAREADLSPLELKDRINKSVRSSSAASTTSISGGILDIDRLLKN